MQALMSEAAVPGVSLARVEHGKVTVISMGVRELGTARSVSEATVFGVASLSKPVTAYIALQLMDDGTLDLDVPLSTVVHNVPELVDSPITARQILTHTSGLPNLLSETALQSHFAPGSRFSYSSMGFLYLQRALETITNEPLEALAERLVFRPLSMHSSSFQWRERFNDDFAMAHQYGKVLKQWRPAAAGAAGSLQTTAADYAKFMIAVLTGASLRAQTHRKWLTPTVTVPRANSIQLENALETDPNVGWGLGWGMEATNGTFFQWGKLDGLRALAMGNVETQTAVVLLTNSNRGLRLMDAAASAVLPDEHPGCPWLAACVTE